MLFMVIGEYLLYFLDRYRNGREDLFEEGGLGGGRRNDEDPWGLDRDFELMWQFYTYQGWIRYACGISDRFELG